MDCTERNTIRGAKGIWNFIMNFEKIGRDFTGMRASLKSLLRIMQTMSLLKKMMKISPHTGLPPSFFSFLFGLVTAFFLEKCYGLLVPCV